MIEDNEQAQHIPSRQKREGHHVQGIRVASPAGTIVSFRWNPHRRGFPGPPAPTELAVRLEQMGRSMGDLPGRVGSHRA